MSFAKLAVTFDGDAGPLAAAASQGKRDIISFADTVKQAQKESPMGDPARMSGIKTAIDEQRKQLGLMKGAFDEVTAKAMEFRRKGAPQELITQYVSLRREILRTADAERMAAEVSAMRNRANASYEASQLRLQTQRQNAIRANASSQNAMMMRGMAGGMNGMLFPMAMNSLAVGFQDAVSVYQVNKSALAAISAAGNNIIFLMTLMHPMAGAIGAVTLGLTQLGVAWLQSGDNAEQSAERQKKAMDEVSERLKEQWKLQSMLNGNDVKGVEGKVSDLAKEVKDKEAEIEFLKQKRDAAYETRRQYVMEDPRYKVADTQAEQFEARREAAFKELDGIQARLGDAKEIARGITPMMRKNESYQNPSQDLISLADKVATLKAETEVLTGKKTELQQLQDEWRKKGTPQAGIDNLTKAFEENRIAKEVEAARKKAEVEQQAATKQAQQESDRRREDGKRLAESMQTPQEKYIAELKRLQDLRSDKTIDDVTYGRAARKAYEERNRDMIKDLPDRVSHAQTLVKGSAEAARVLQTGRTDEKMLTIAEKSLATSKEIASNTKRSNPLQKTPRVMGES